MLYFKYRFRASFCLLPALLLFPMGRPTFLCLCCFFTRPVRPRWEEYRLRWSDSTHSAWGRDHMLLWRQLFWWRQWNVWMLHLWEVCPSSRSDVVFIKAFFFALEADFIHPRDENSHLFNSSLGTERVTSNTEGNSPNRRKQRTPWARSTAWERDIFASTESGVTFLQGQQHLEYTRESLKVTSLGFPVK